MKGKAPDYAVVVRLEQINYYLNDEDEYEEDTRDECLEATIRQSPDHEENRVEYERIVLKMKGEGIVNHCLDAL